MTKVTDPELLRQLNSKVTDPKLLAELNGGGSTSEQRAAVRASFEKAANDRALAEDYSGAKGLLANYGAGVDNLVQGVKSLFSSRSDEDIEESRANKKRLGDSTLGGGVAQFLGEAVTSAPITMGAGGAAGAAAAKALPKATAWALRNGGKVANVGTVGRGALEGAVGGALAETTSDESRGVNATLGGTLGAAAPVAFAGGSKLANMTRKKYAPNRAAGAFTEHLGPKNLDEISDALHAPNQSLLPLSTAARSQNVPLASLERGARSGRGDWSFEHDKPVAETAWGRLKGATDNADELPARIADREDMMQASKEYLSSFDDPKLLTKANNDLSDAIETMRKTPEVRQNPELTRLMGQTEETLLHPERNAGDFAAQYWRLSAMLDDSKLTVDQKGAIMKLRDAVAEAADTASNGEFSPLLGRYMAEEGHVGQAEASKTIRETFQSPEGVIKTKDVFGTPEVQSSVLRKTLASKGEGPYGNKLAPNTRAELIPLEKELGQHELWQAKNSPGATSMEDSSNPVTIFGSGANNPFNRLWAARGAANWSLKGSRKNTAEAAEAALRSPEAWKKMMDDYAKSQSPLIPKEYAERLRRRLLLLPGQAGAVGLGGE